MEALFLPMSISLISEGEMPILLVFKTKETSEIIQGV